MAFSLPLNHTALLCSMDRISVLEYLHGLSYSHLKHIFVVGNILQKMIKFNGNLNGN